MLRKARNRAIKMNECFSEIHYNSLNNITADSKGSLRFQFTGGTFSERFTLNERATSLPGLPGAPQGTFSIPNHPKSPVIPPSAEPYHLVQGHCAIWIKQSAGCIPRTISCLIILIKHCLNEF